MSNMYHVTLSYPQEYWHLYHTHLNRLHSAKYVTRFIVARQNGKNGDHPHFHVLVETDAKDARILRMRFRSIIKEFKITEINLRVETYDISGKWYNYVRREKGVHIMNSRVKPFDLKLMKTESKKYPDKKVDPKGKPPLYWSNFRSELKRVGWVYGKPLHRYLRILGETYYIDNIILAPRRIAILLKFWESDKGEDWEDVYKAAANFTTRGNYE